jgi:hypothetical protein
VARRFAFLWIDRLDLANVAVGIAGAALGVVFGLQLA